MTITDAVLVHMDAEFGKAYIANIALVRGKVSIIHHHSGGRYYDLPGVVEGLNPKYDHHPGGRRYRVTCVRAGQAHVYQCIGPSNIMTLAEYAARKANRNGNTSY